MCWQMDEYGNPKPWYNAEAMDQWDKEYKLMPLHGTMKQVVYARDIRHKYMSDLFKRFDQIPTDMIPTMEALRMEQRAKVWITLFREHLGDSVGDLPRAAEGLKTIGAVLEQEDQAREERYADTVARRREEWVLNKISAKLWGAILRWEKAEGIKPVTTSATVNNEVWYYTKEQKNLARRIRYAACQIGELNHADLQKLKADVDTTEWLQRKKIYDAFIKVKVAEFANPDAAIRSPFAAG